MNPANVQYEGAMPVPKGRRAWLVAVILTAAIMVFYYACSYPRLYQADKDAYDYTAVCLPPDARTVPTCSSIEIRVASPTLISNTSGRLLQITVTNYYSETKSITLVPEIEIEPSQDPMETSIGTGNNKDVFVALDAAADEGFLLQTSVAEIQFPSVPPQAALMQQISLNTRGLASGDSITINLGVLISGIEAESEKSRIPITIEVNEAKAIAQDIVSFALLPPWSNGFIPLFGLFAAYLLLVDKLDKRKTLEPGFLAWIITGGAFVILFVWAATDLALILVDGDRGRDSLVILAIVLVGLVYALYWIDKNCLGNESVDPEMLDDRTARPVGAGIPLPGMSPPENDGGARQVGYRESKDDGPIATTPPPDREQHDPGAASSRVARDEEGIEAATSLTGHQAVDSSHETAPHSPSEPSDDVTPLEDELLTSESDGRPGSLQSTAETAAAEDSSHPAPPLLLPPPTETAHDA